VAGGTAIIATRDELRQFEQSPCKHCGRPLGRERAFGILFPEPIGLVGFVHQTVCLSAYVSQRQTPEPMLIEVA
jgi:hypothetical protein